jgi:surface antigen
MNHLDCARRVAAVMLAAILILPGAALARQKTRLPIPVPRPALSTDVAAAPAVDGVSTAAPVYSIIANDPFTDDTPSIVISKRRIYCVQYARLRSGIEIYGDAKTWWEKARGLYAEDGTPKPGAVMVFASTRKMDKGHVAVVRRVVSSREIRIDHANWHRDGNIYLNAPVFDVSAANDWSVVRVWDTRNGRLGSLTFPIKGFVSFRTAALK